MSSHVKQLKELSEAQPDDWEQKDFPIVCEKCLGYVARCRLLAVDAGGAVYSPIVSIALFAGAC